MITFLQALGVSWPTAPGSWTNGEREEKIQEALKNCRYRERGMERSRRTSGGGRRKAEEEEEDQEEENKEALRVNLKRVFQEEELLGYDPSLGTCTGEVRRLPLNRGNWSGSCAQSRCHVFILLINNQIKKC